MGKPVEVLGSSSVDQLTAFDDYARHLRTQNATDLFNDELFTPPDEPVTVQVHL